MSYGSSYSTAFKFRLHLKTNNDPPTLFEVVFFECDPDEKNKSWEHHKSRRKNDLRGAHNVSIAKTIAAFVYKQYPGYTLVGVL